jgi:hypothetical protein
MNSLDLRGQNWNVVTANNLAKFTTKKKRLPLPSSTAGGLRTASKVTTGSVPGGWLGKCSPPTLSLFLPNQEALLSFHALGFGDGRLRLTTLPRRELIPAPFHRTPLHA